MRNTNTHAKMKAIFKHENVYVLVDTEKNLRENVDGALIFKFPSKNSCKQLYGGRVILWDCCSSSEGRIKIDGISIYRIDFCKFSNSKDYCLEETRRLSISEIVSFLNQIENLGVDAFLENYKNQLKVLKQNIEEILKYQEPNDQKKYLIESLQRLRALVVVLLFSLSINMNAGLTNQHYTNAYETIINTYFN